MRRWSWFLKCDMIFVRAHSVIFEGYHSITKLGLYFRIHSYPHSVCTLFDKLEFRTCATSSQTCIVRWGALAVEYGRAMHSPARECGLLHGMWRSILWSRICSRIAIPWLWWPKSSIGAYLVGITTFLKCYHLFEPIVPLSSKLRRLAPPGGSLRSSRRTFGWRSESNAHPPFIMPPIHAEKGLGIRREVFGSRRGTIQSPAEKNLRKTLHDTIQKPMGKITEKNLSWQAQRVILAISIRTLVIPPAPFSQTSLADWYNVCVFDQETFGHSPVAVCHL
jgi:hypothetical protein